MQAPRLPTRVNTACQRCRKQKQRCDASRPCSNCLKGGHQCTATLASPRPSTQTSRDTVEAQTSRQGTHRSRKRPRSASGSPHRARRAHVSDISEQASGREEQEDSDGRRETMSPNSSSKEQAILAELGRSTSAMDITRRVLRVQGIPYSLNRATFAIPGGDFNATTGVGHRDGQYPIASLIGIELPVKATCDRLIDIYFYTVHWFSLVVHEPMFRQKYESIVGSSLAKSTDRPFLLLLLMVFVMSCQYATPMVDGIDVNGIGATCLKVVRENYMDLIEEDSLEFTQICALLGSYWLYWGKPRTAFTLLGAAIKSAQSMSLHRLSSKPFPMEHTQLIEERKRVWWTIYTWDRFATIVYGRPLGIADKDCDIAMPVAFVERLVDLETSEVDSIELSPYQVHLNRIYQIASPVLESVFGTGCTDVQSLLELARNIQLIARELKIWRSELPYSLKLEDRPDLTEHLTLKEKMHSLQALSLRLTYLNLMIVIHRPLLSDWRQAGVQHGQPRRNAHYDRIRRLSVADNERLETSLDECLAAAMSISSLETSKPNLIRLAGKTHLVSFLAMNTFTSSIVLFIGALSDVLSDSAQQAKRGISGNIRILKSLSNTGSLSKQCSAIIRDLIQVIMDKEKKELLMEETQPEEAADQIHNHATHDHAQYTEYTGISDRQPEGNDQGAAYDRSFSQVNAAVDPTFGEPDTSMGETMEQLHRVLQSASRTQFVPQRQSTGQEYSAAENSSTAELLDTSWPTTSYPWDRQDLFGMNTAVQDMNQFWLWDVNTSID